MKRSTLVLITAGMILGGAGVVEILGTDTAASGAVHPAVVGDLQPARESPRSYPNATIAPGTAIQPFSEVHQLAAQQPSDSIADISTADGLLSIPAAAPRTYPG